MTMEAMLECPRGTVAFGHIHKDAAHLFESAIFYI
jgi:hypothetical protein